MRFLLASVPAVIALAIPASTHVYTGRLNDVFRVPGAALQCEVSKEARMPDVSCGHVPYARARYQVVFYKDNVLVYRLRRPDNPVWSAKGRP
jgi:hypothetical protein